MIERIQFLLMNYRIFLERCLLSLVAATTTASAATVYNSSFEQNYSEEFPHYGEIEEWQGGSGVNQADGPFHNGGTPIPDQARVAFIQGSSTLSQEILDFEPGELHWLQFFYDARGCCGGTIDLVVRLDDVELATITNVKPSTDGNPYKFINIPFTPEFDFGVLGFQTIASGDATLNLDGIAILRGEEGEVPLMNPSFEASGEPVDPDGIISPNGVAGWVGEGTFGVNADGAGTFADNGRSSEPDYVGFLTDVSSLTQTLDGLVVGTDYELTFEYNASSGNAPELVVALGDEEVFRESVSAVGGNSRYRQGAVTFRADDVQKVLSFRQINEGNHTVLLDSIHLAGEVGESFPPMEVSPSAIELAPGQMAEVTVTLPDAFVAIKGGQVSFTSPNPGVAVPVGADDGGRLAIDFEQGGATSQTIQVVGVARGAVRMVVTPPSGLEVANDTAVNVVSSFVRNASFESNEAPPGIGAGTIVSWSGGTGLNKGGGPFHDNGAIPDRLQVAVMQGSQTLSQEISGLTEGESYWLQFHYNARNCCGGTIGFAARFAGEELWQIEEVIPAAADGLETYYFQNVPFTASASSGLLEFVTAAEGDATVLLDAVNIVPRGEDEIVIANPSFEASGSPVGVGYVQPANIAGWGFTGGGRGPNVTGQGPFADNGSGLDQDSVLFIQGPTSMTQLIEGLEPGETYTLYYYVNARNCCGEGGFTFYSVSFDEEILLEEEVLPVGGVDPFHLRFVRFTASFADGVLQFDTQPEGDHSLLLDDIHIVRGEFVPPTPEPPVVLPPVPDLPTAGEISGIRLNGDGSVTIDYTGELQSAAAVDGPFAPVDGASSPFTVTPGDEANQFYIAQ